MPVTRGLDEKFEKLFPKTAEMKSGLEKKMESRKEDLRSGMKYEAADTSSKISGHARRNEAQDDVGKGKEDKFESLLKALGKLLHSLAFEQNAPRRNPNVICCKCYESAHVHRE
ncbi:hypothetical protein AVEN_199889-1 [Araneus ventricosus]|uniref:Uncharacterized protein n=1 Tax=Araneus ventricosus TaxID=182803 RepID=A0A4Y2U6U8_ARAVE|nr:hypothetical protein AVEN_12914-1 [Araneus ventricosus]GBO07320.1 hypothetical protein AVEN_84634-1 [Araneus ventricosus]GBO07321.1 hypothetical protein AVEN_218215-1 [Araneus ventricosus]GBO07375.1 hypothetical protein AVEN_199889-1 [Araneus ventricosus]